MSVKRIPPQKNENKLQRAVRLIINNHIINYDTREQFFSDLQQGGCMSGLIGELIYYNDTTKFYNKYKKEINSLLYDTFENYGDYDPTSIFGNNWDKQDPLVIEIHNQNLLAWFGFEETAFNIAREIGIEI